MDFNGCAGTNSCWGQGFPRSARYVPTIDEFVSKHFSLPRPSGQDAYTHLMQQQMQMSSYADLVDSSYKEYMQRQDRYGNEENEREQCMQRFCCQRPARTVQSVQPFQIQMPENFTDRTFAEYIRERQKQKSLRPDKRVQEQCSGTERTANRFHVRCLPPGNLPCATCTSVGRSYKF